MSALISLRPGIDWSASGGLFDWTLEFLIPRLDDRKAAERLQEIVDNNLGSLWLSEFAPRTQQEILSQLRNGLVAAAERDLPASDYKGAALHHLQELVDMTDVLKETD